MDLQADLGATRASEFFRQFRVNPWINDPSPLVDLPIITPADGLRDAAYGHSAYGKAALGYLALKGSIAVDGVSLTVNAVVDRERDSEFTVNLIPHTVEHTTLRGLSLGSPVNLEVDSIARYVERMLAVRSA